MVESSQLALPVAVVLIVLLSAGLRLHPFFSLLLPAVGFGALFLPLEASLDAFSAGVGRTTGGVGVIILCGSVIGAFLDRTDAVTSIAQARPLPAAPRASESTGCVRRASCRRWARRTRCWP